MEVIRNYMTKNFNLHPQEEN